MTQEGLVPAGLSFDTRGRYILVSLAIQTSHLFCQTQADADYSFETLVYINVYFILFFKVELEDLLLRAGRLLGDSI